MTDEKTETDSSSNNRPAVHAYITLLGAQIAIGAAAIFARFALHGAGPISVSAWRLVIAAVPLLILSWPRSRQLAISRRHELMFALCGVLLGSHFATWIASLQYTSVAVSTLLACTSPVWTALYDTLILKKKMGGKFWLAFLAAGVGLALIVCTSSGTPPPIAGMELLGDLLAVAGAMVFAVYLIMIRSISDRYPTIVVVGRTYSWAALALVIAALVSQQPPPPVSDVESWGGILAMALISQLLGHTALNAALKSFTPSTVAFSTLVEPVFAAVLATFIFAESLSVQVMIGSVLVLVSLGVILKIQPVEVQRQVASESNEL